MSTFDWDNLAQSIQENALDDGMKKGYEEDTRFYKLSRDKDNIPFIKMVRINANKGYNDRFCKEWSPQSIGKPDPFNEMFTKLWREGKKEEAKKFGRSIRYIANIKILKDPANPENEGKFFLLDMSPSLFDKVKNAVQPSEDEIALGTEPKAVFNPIKGNSFLLKIKEGSNGFLTYEDSKFNEKVDGIYKSEKEAIEDIKKNAYSLKEFLEPDFFKSYDELKECLDWFMGIENTEPKTDTAETTETKETKETKDDAPFDTGLEMKEEKENTETDSSEDLDELLANL